MKSIDEDIEIIKKAYQYANAMDQLDFKPYESIGNRSELFSKWLK